MVSAGLTRRGLLIGAAALVGAAACSQKPTVQDKPDPSQPLSPFEDRVAALEQANNAFVGLFAVDVDSGTSLAHRADDPFAMCSTFKGYAASRVLQKAAGRELSLADAIRIEQADIVANSPVTQPRVGSTMTVAELCQAALQRSDNCAGNWLLRLIGGPQAVTEFARTIGDDRTRLDRWETALNSAVPGDPRDTSTPRALGTGYRTLLSGDALDKPQRDQLDSWMRGNQTSSLRAGLPSDWATADKTGSGDYGSTNDVGIAYGPDGRRLLLSIMIRSQANDANAGAFRPLVGQLATLVLPYLGRKP